MNHISRTPQTKTKSSQRNSEVIQQYFDLLDNHLDELITGKADQMLELSDISRILCISQKHLIKIIKTEKGEHPCHFYMQKIIAKSKKLLSETNLSITDIAYRLTYDPSNFTKFFKKYTGTTPSQFRNPIKAKSSP
ncbi:MULTISPECIES: helix-turn-helix domain-containing protein [Chitinophagaceae]